MTREMIIKELKTKGYNAEAVESVKNGVVMEGISIRMNKAISPIIYTADIISYAERHGLSIAWVIDEILDIYNEHKDYEFNIDIVFSRNFLSQNTYIGFQKTSTENILRRESEFAGIEMYLYIRGNEWNIKANKAILERANITEDTLWRCAMNNTVREAELVSMMKVICELQDIPYYEDMDEDNPMYILTNKDKFRGASAILNKQLLVEFADKHHTHKLVVIPSSIHETLIMPYTNELSIDDLKNFVANVNLTAVDPTERLTDEVYIVEIKGEKQTNKENYNIIIECGDYALIDRGHEYVVAYKLNKENMSWAQGHYFSPWPQTQERKLAMLQAATSFMLRKVTDDHSPSEIRFREVAEKCITYVSEQCGEDEVACDLMDELDLSYDEKEYFNV